MSSTTPIVASSPADTFSLNALFSVYTRYKQYEVEQESAIRAQRVRDRAFSLQKEALADERRQTQQGFELALRRQNTLDALEEKRLDIQRERIAADVAIARGAQRATKRRAKFGLASAVVRGAAAYYTGGASEAVVS